MSCKYENGKKLKMIIYLKCTPNELNFKKQIDNMET